MKNRIIVAVLISLLTLLSQVSCAKTSQPPGSLTVPAGYDLFTTAHDGRSFFVLGGNGEKLIPEGFFGCLSVEGVCLASDPIDRPVRVSFGGLPTGDLGFQAGVMTSSPCKWVSDSSKFGIHCADGVGHFSPTAPHLPSELENVNTIVFRVEDLQFDEIGDIRSIPIELTSHSMKSIEPVEISYGGGQGHQRFHVTVLGPREKGRRGAMVVSRTGATSGTYFSRLPMSANLTFTNVESDGPEAVEEIALDVDLVGVEVLWEVPERG